MTRTAERQMGACIIGDGRQLTLDTGDGAYMLQDYVVTGWTITRVQGAPEVTAYGNHFPIELYMGLSNIKVDLSLVAGKWGVSDKPIPRQIETYSVTDMLHIINAKLQERAQ